VTEMLERSKPPAPATADDRQHRPRRRRQPPPALRRPAGDDDAPPPAQAAFDDIIAAAIALGGTVSGEHGIGLLKRAGLAAQVGPDVMALYTAVKQALDRRGSSTPARSSEPEPGEARADRSLRPSPASGTICALRIELVQHLGR